VRLRNFDLSTKGGSSFHAGTPEVPDVQRDSTSSTRAAGGGKRVGGRRTDPDWVKTPPAEGYPATREHEGREYKYCGVCTRWLYGDRGHFTNKHVPGYKSKKLGKANAVLDSESSDEEAETSSTDQTDFGLQQNSLFFSAGF
jgi:hypothetical protein